MFLLPGLHGSRLRAGDTCVWPSPVQIARQGIKRIGTSQTDIWPDGLLRSRYGALARHLRQTNDVIEFHYDWRTSTVDQAAILNASVRQALDATAATGQPIRFVAHSMGGIVARMFIARHRATWDAMLGRGHGAELVMLGTPNAGAMSTVWSLVGMDRMVRLLGAMDLQTPMADFLSEIAKMPGLLELLPGDGNGRYFKADTWDQMAAVAPQGWRPPTAQALAAAWAARQALIPQAEDSRHMAYVAGRAAVTPVSIDLRQEQGKWIPRMIATKAGDGRVAWQSGQLPEVSTWYASQTSHGNLPRDTGLFQAIDDLLAHGRTDRLPNQAPVVDDESALFTATRPEAFGRLKGLAASYRSFAASCWPTALTRTLQA